MRAKSYPNDAALGAGQQGNRVATAALGALPRCPVCSERVLRLDDLCVWLPPGVTIERLLPSTADPDREKAAESHDPGGRSGDADVAYRVGDRESQVRIDNLLKGAGLGRAATAILGWRSRSAIQRLASWFRRASE